MANAAVLSKNPIQPLDDDRKFCVTSALKFISESPETAWPNAQERNLLEYLLHKMEDTGLSWVLFSIDDYPKYGKKTYDDLVAYRNKYIDIDVPGSTAFFHVVTIMPKTFQTLAKTEATHSAAREAKIPRDFSARAERLAVLEAV